jgi:hypothetical protein
VDLVRFASSSAAARNLELLADLVVASDRNGLAYGLLSALTSIAKNERRGYASRISGWSAVPKDRLFYAGS